MYRFLRHWGCKIKGRSKVLSRARGPSINWKRNRAERHSDLKFCGWLSVKEQMRQLWASNYIQRQEHMLSEMMLKQCELGYIPLGTSTTWRRWWCKTHLCTCVHSVTSDAIGWSHVCVKPRVCRDLITVSLGWFVILYKPSHLYWEGFGTP